MEVMRVLLYRGPDKWVEQTLDRSIQGGIQLGLREGPASIQEARLPGWLSMILAWYTRRRPKAKFSGGSTPYYVIDQRGVPKR